MNQRYPLTVPPRPVRTRARTWSRARALELGLAGVLTLSATLVAAPAAAAESRIELRDGSVISGELVSIGDGRYRVRSSALGEVSIPESQVLAIRPAGAPTALPAAPSVTPAPAAAGTAPTGLDIGSIRQQILGQPETMEAIGRLQDDPQIKSLLSDPELVRRIMSGDIEAVRSDPRFQQLLANPSIRAIVSRFLGSGP